MTTTTAKSVRITLDGVGSHVFHLDWTARIAERARRELGCTPETLMRELSGAIEGREPSLDSIAKLFAFVAWCAGDASVTYDGLLDVVRISTTLHVEDVTEDSSPEV